ncbi:MAG: hypothetical protein NZT61_01910 [Deltaproteobacteria bacterium]|nr:hypothetical protein [Deltaproteobacteria bacterium]MCX7953272.1 hypothetical protein [Deltaproteobacteria bacterium]
MLLPLFRPLEGDYIMYVYNPTNILGLIKIYDHSASLINEVKIMGQEILNFNIKTIFDDNQTYYIRASLGYLDVNNLILKAFVKNGGKTFPVNPLKKVLPGYWYFAKPQDTNVIVLNPNEKTARLTLNIADINVSIELKKGLISLPLSFPDYMDTPKLGSSEQVYIGFMNFF